MPFDMSHTTPNGGRLVLDIPAKIERRTDREANGPTAIPQQIVEQVIVDYVDLGSYSEVFGG